MIFMKKQRNLHQCNVIIGPCPYDDEHFKNSQIHCLSQYRDVIFIARYP